MALGFLGAFIWAMRTGQQDDLYTPSLRILTEDDPEQAVPIQTVTPKRPRTQTSISVL